MNDDFTLEQLRTTAASFRGEGDHGTASLMERAADRIVTLHNETVPVGVMNLFVGAVQEAVEAWEPLLADADLDAGENPAWLAVQRLKGLL